MDPSPPEGRARGCPAAVEALFAAGEDGARDRAWARFVASYSRLILHVTRASGAEYDDAMDSYAFVLDELSRDDFRRLRAYTADGRARFTTWLTVVVRRLCMDHYRRRYGRHRGGDEAVEGAEAARRRLVDLVGEAVDVEELGDGGRDPEMRLRAKEVREALIEAIAELDARDRLLLAMRFEDGRTARVIAEAMGYPTPFHVYRRVDAVLKALRSSLAERGIHEPAP